MILAHAERETKWRARVSPAVIHPPSVFDDEATELHLIGIADELLRR
ncbi:MAG: hypothetical protein ACREBG_25830 [Pyrinomonadaceae bacterium]